MSAPARLPPARPGKANKPLPNLPDEPRARPPPPLEMRRKSLLPPPPTPSRPLASSSSSDLHHADADESSQPPPKPTLMPPPLPWENVQRLSTVSVQNPPSPSVRTSGSSYCSKTLPLPKHPPKLPSSLPQQQTAQENPSPLQQVSLAKRSSVLGDVYTEYQIIQNPSHRIPFNLMSLPMPNYDVINSALFGSLKPIASPSSTVSPYEFLQLIGSVPTSDDIALSRFKVRLLSRESRDFVRKHGFPPCLRAIIWESLCESGMGKENWPDYYSSVIQQLSQHETKSCRDIDKDVLRTLQAHPLFSNSLGKHSLKRMLSVISFRLPHIGYCQSMNTLAAVFLFHSYAVSPSTQSYVCGDDTPLPSPNNHSLTVDDCTAEERAFWLLECLISKVLPEVCELAFCLCVDC